jgi:hypothetical protein
MPAEPAGDGGVHELGLGSLRRGPEAGLGGEGVPHRGDDRQAYGSATYGTPAAAPLTGVLWSLIRSCR